MLPSLQPLQYHLDYSCFFAIDIFNTFQIAT